MSSINKHVPNPAPKTFEGSPSYRLSNVKKLFRSVASCMLWEDQFYESGSSIADRIVELSLTVKPSEASAIARFARNDMKLRHVGLLIARALASGTAIQKAEVSDLLYEIIQRPDELTEFLAIYWKDGKTPIAAGVKKGLARAFTKFNEYSLAKYNRNGAIKLRDVLFLTHPKPLNEKQQELWNRLAKNELATPDTWETRLSSGANKKESFVELIEKNELGALALLRNLRNMIESDVESSVIKNAILTMKTERVLPFRFITAARYAPQFEPELESAMYRCLTEQPKLKGKTALIVDTSPSMWQSRISAKSELDRFDAAAALSILCREICEDVAIYTFDGDGRRIPPRRGFALRDAMNSAKDIGGGSYGNGAIDLANNDGYNRIIVLTDGEWHSGPVNSRMTRSEVAMLTQGKANAMIHNPLVDNAYLINVGSYVNAIGSGKWNMIDGWSEALIDYIRIVEDTEMKNLFS